MSASEARVRLHARLNADVVPIAYCRHAQARILVREGQAEWVEGRLVLQDAIAFRHKDVHPVLSECYEKLGHRSEVSRKTLAYCDQVLPVVESMLGPSTKVEARLNLLGEVWLLFEGVRQGAYHAGGWIEVWGWGEGASFRIYLNRFRVSESVLEPSWRESEQEVVGLGACGVHRYGPAAVRNLTPSERPSFQYAFSGDILDALAFELQGVRAVLLDPAAAPWLVDLPAMDPVISS